MRCRSEWHAPAPPMRTRTSPGRARAPRRRGTPPARRIRSAETRGSLLLNHERSLSKTSGSGRTNVCRAPAAADDRGGDAPITTRVIPVRPWADAVDPSRHTAIGVRPRPGAHVRRLRSRRVEPAKSSALGAPVVVLQGCGVRGRRDRVQRHIAGDGLRSGRCASVRCRDAERRARTIRVFLLDDHEIVRRGVREPLEAEDAARRTRLFLLTNQERRILALIGKGSTTARSARRCTWPRRR